MHGTRNRERDVENVKTRRTTLPNENYETLRNKRPRTSLRAPRRLVRNERLHDDTRGSPRSRYFPRSSRKPPTRIYVFCVVSVCRELVTLRKRSVCRNSKFNTLRKIIRQERFGRELMWCRDDTKIENRNSLETTVAAGRTSGLFGRTRARDTRLHVFHVARPTTINRVRRRRVRVPVRTTPFIRTVRVRRVGENDVKSMC